MRNPWANLSLQSPYVIDGDRAIIDRHNIRAKGDFRYDLSLYPDPFVGLPNSPVVLLMLNPGLGETDHATHSDPRFREIAYSNLNHRIPFYYSGITIACGGSKYWDVRLGKLFDAVGNQKLVLRNIFLVQYIPYHSKKYKPAPYLLPSQEYTKFLIRASMANGAEIVLMRSKSIWRSLIPELSNYGKLHEASSVLSGHVSPGNILNNGFQKIAERIMESA